MIFCQRLRDLRIDHDKSQAEIAKIIGTSQSYYAQYENGKRGITLERVIILELAEPVFSSEAKMEPMTTPTSP